MSKDISQDKTTAPPIGGVARDMNFDFIRAIAIILVVFTHIHERLDTGKTHLLLTSFFYSIDRIGVPLFFFLIGTFSFKKAARDPLGFIYPRILQFLVLLFFWSFFTGMAQIMLFQGRPFQHALAEWFFHANAFFPAKYYGLQFWFLYAIIPLYVLLPIFAKAFQSFSQKEYLIFLMILSVLAFGTTYPFRLFVREAVWADGTILQRIKIGFPLTYILYVLFGNFLLVRINLERIHGYFGLFIFLIAIFTMNWIVYDLGQIPQGFMWYTESFLLFLGSLGLLIFLRVSKFSSKFFSFLGKQSFGIYLSHYLFLIFVDYLYGLTGLDRANFWLSIPVYFTLTFCGSAIFCSLLDRFFQRFRFFIT